MHVYEDKDWEDLRKMPEHPTLVKEFKKSRSVLPVFLKVSFTRPFPNSTRPLLPPLSFFSSSSPSFPLPFQPNNVATLPCKMKRSPSRYTTTPKRTKFHKKARNLLVHIFELSTAVVKVNIKVIMLVYLKINVYNV